MGESRRHDESNLFRTTCKLIVLLRGIPVNFARSLRALASQKVRRLIIGNSGNSSNTTAAIKDQEVASQDHCSDGECRWFSP